MFCPKCGSMMPEGAKFCENCGAPMAQPETAASPEPKPQSDPRPEVSFEQTRSVFQQPLQQTYQQPEPEPQPYAEPVRQAAQVEEKAPNPFLVFFLTVLICGSLLAAFMMFVKPGYMLHRDDESSTKSSSREDKPKKTETEKPAETTATEKPAETSAPEETTTTAAETTTAATETAPPETSTPDGPNGAPDIDLTKYHTEEKAVFEDFDWYYGQDSFNTDVPADAEEITDSVYIIGGWKALLDYNPGNADLHVQETDNVDISESDDGFKFVFKGYQFMVEGSDPLLVDDGTEEEYIGKVENGVIIIETDTMTIKIKHFWTKKDSEGVEHQYAAGKLYLNESEFGNIVFVRP